MAKANGNKLEKRGRLEDRGKWMGKINILFSTPWVKFELKRSNPKNFFFFTTFLEVLRITGNIIIE